MGQNFKLAEWSDTWLKTSGVNMLEGVATYDKDSKIESFAIKQSFDSMGKNQLRQ
jgi:aminopeptidase N